MELIYDAALRTYWRKKPLRRFLRRHGVSDNFLATWAEDETKRDFLDRLFPQLERSDKGTQVLLSMAKDLATREDFPDLKGWDESSAMIQEALQAVASLSKALGARVGGGSSDTTDASRRQADANVANVRRSELNLAKLQADLGELAKSLGTQEAGYGYQSWFYELMAHFEIKSRRPYVSNGRQIDGSITIAGTTYLVELKFTKGPVSATDIDSLFTKVNSKADNTMAIMVSMSGYTKTAISTASTPRTPLLLLDQSHVIYCLQGLMTFAELVERVRRHASQTGEAYLPTSQLA